MLFGCFFNSHFVFVSGKHISFLNACAFGFAVIKKSSYNYTLLYIRELLVHKFLSVHNHYTLVALVYLLTGEIIPLAIILLLDDDWVRDACRKA